MTPRSSVVVASCPDRQRADALAEELQKRRIAAIVSLSLHRAGSWDVLVLAGDEDRARAMLQPLDGD